MSAVFNDPPAAALRICAQIRPRNARGLAPPSPARPEVPQRGHPAVGTRWRSEAEHAENRKAIAALLAQGKKQRDIVRALKLSRSYVYTMSKKLGRVCKPRGATK